MKGYLVGGNKIQLTARDYFLLGTLAGRANGTSQLPQGCTDEQAKRLAQEGYLERALAFAADGQEIVRYRITAKGEGMWQAYRFIRGSPE